MSEHLSLPSPTPRYYEVVTQTWLTRKPDPSSVSVALSATLAVVLGALIYLLDAGGFAHLMSASGESVFAKHEYWRLWTTLFAHADLGHLSANISLFFVLGFFLYGYFGSSLFPLAALFWGGIINLLVLKTYDPEIQLIGASGVVYWMGGAWLILYFFLSRQKNLFQRWLRTFGVALLIFMPAETFDPHVSYRTHLTGFALGVLAGGWHYLRNRQRFLAAEVREKIIDEDLDPIDLRIEEVANAGDDNIPPTAQSRVE